MSEAFLRDPECRLPVVRNRHGSRRRIFSGLYTPLEPAITSSISTLSLTLGPVRSTMGHDPSIGEEPVRRLHAVDAAIGFGHADRPARDAAAGHVHFPGGDEGCRAPRRTACGIAHLVRVVHHSCRIGMAAAGEANILAVRLALYGRASIEELFHDCPTARPSCLRACPLPHPGCGTCSTRRCTRFPHLAGNVRIAYLRKVVREAVDDIVRVNAAGYEADERLYVVLAQGQTDLVREIAQLLRSRHPNWHLRCHPAGVLKPV